MPNKDLLVVGELNVDLILNKIEGFPKIGTEIIAENMNVTLGSSSAIMAANASAIGINTSFCGIIGKDDFGDFILNALQKKHVNTVFINRTGKQKSGITVVMNYGQDRANITYCGAMEMLQIQDIPWDDLHQFKHFHLSNFFIQKGIRKDITAIFKKAKACGLSTSLDLQWDPENKWDFNYKECLPHVDVFMPNEAELLALTKTTTVNNGIEEIMPYANTIVIKMGDKGSMAFHNGETYQALPYANPNYVDSIGAGDSFNAGFIKKYIEKQPIETCLKFGNLTGALNTTAAGGTTAFSDKKNVIEDAIKLFNAEI
ncbi:carbohydrate kinase family protein [Galbibacter sp. PAP.153]|uniref:carbohydrate kinase family protein n=1 Tax=Galbibacter sp. PAP.153 TaxID=3104623 RepID=UPI00300A8A88